MNGSNSSNYERPEVLVNRKWVEENANAPGVRIDEVDYDIKANYMLGHAPGSVLFDWKQDINHPINRTALSKQAVKIYYKKLELMTILH